MNTKKILESASIHLDELKGHVFDLLTISKPKSLESAINLSKVISKLSPILGNLIEFNTVEFLNSKKEYEQFGKWKRQDPGFPDAIFEGEISPTPGLEIKAWFPLATEITARFKDSQNHFSEDQTKVCILAWLPENLIYGKPKIIDVCVISGRSIAMKRDNHYHNPPDYIVLEPENTTARTVNLRQSNTNGHKWQGTPEEFLEAKKLVDSWGEDGKVYQPTPEYQKQLRELIQKYNYRLDTNFAKIDRINHPELEKFKTKVQSLNFHGPTIKEWIKIISKKGNSNVKDKFSTLLDIKEKISDQDLLILDPE